MIEPYPFVDLSTFATAVAQLDVAPDRMKHSLRIDGYVGVPHWCHIKLIETWLAQQFPKFNVKLSVNNYHPVKHLYYASLIVEAQSTCSTPVSTPPGVGVTVSSSIVASPHSARARNCRTR